jgi:hypothetical protein
MKKVKQNFKANNAQKVKQLLNKKVIEGGNMVKISRNLASISGVPGGIRTHDPLLRRQPLYPLSYRDG